MASAQHTTCAARAGGRAPPSCPRDLLVFFALRLVLALPAVSRRSMSTTSLMGSWTPTSASPAWAATTMSVTWRLELHQAPGDAGPASRH